MEEDDTDAVERLREEVRELREKTSEQATKNANLGFWVWILAGLVVTGIVCTQCPEILPKEQGPY